MTTGGGPLVPRSRIDVRNDRPERGDGAFVLYWMIAARRTRYHFGLQRAREWAEKLNRPLVALEALRCDYPWASDRLHAFLLEGMRDNERAFTGRPLLYYPFVETATGAGRGLLDALLERAC